MGAFCAILRGRRRVEIHTIQNLFRRQYLTPLLVLVLGMLLVLLTWFGFRVLATHSAEAAFEFQALQVIEEIRKRMRGHALILLGGAGFFSASDSVNRDQWQAYVDRLELPKYIPGIQGVGYSKLIKPAELQSFTTEIREQGFSNFAVRPEGTRDLYSAIIYLEPFVGRNIAAFGYDMLSEPTRAQAMRKAAESGNPVISGKVILQQETQGPLQAGFLMYLPIYHKHRSLQTAADRWAAVKGFVYSPFRMDDLMQRMLETQIGEIGLAIYDGLEVNDETRMYDSHDGENDRPVFSIERRLESFGHTWTIKFYSLPQFVANLNSGHVWEVLTLETVVVLILTVLVFIIIRGRERARELAENISQREREVSELNTNLEQQVHHRTIALDALSHKEEEVRAIVDTVRDGIITIDAAGTVETFNTAAVQIFGYEAEDVIGRNIKMLMPEPYHGEHDGYLHNFLKTGDAKVIGVGREMTGRRKDGTTFPLQLAVDEMSVTGKRMFAGVVNDITAHKKFVEDLEQTREDAEQANRAKSQFLASMSHEIRTPLNGILGNLELLALTRLDDEQVDMLDDADKASKALLALIGNILDFSKIEAGKFALETGDVDIAAVMEDAVHVLQSKARQKGIFVVMTFAADVPKLVRSDGPRIRQILLNLIGNALKFTDVGGVVVDLSVTARDQNVCELQFTVSDSGKGFDQTLADQLFEPFAQNETVSVETEGTGLGLSISRGLVENFGGSIDCESAPDEGATFRFTIPTLVVEPATAIAAPDLSGETVLMVGDIDGDERWLAAYFQARGATVNSIRSFADLFSDLESQKSSGKIDPKIAILHTSNVQNLDSEAVRNLRAQGLVPLIYGPALTNCNRRLILRSGFATLLPKDPNTDFLDRNISLILGHALNHDRPFERRTASAPKLELASPRIRVLVLEDRLVNQTIIGRQLGVLGVNFEMVANGVEGLEILGRENFDLALCDCSMPEMNGYDFARALRRKEKDAGKGHHLPIIALTANAFREDAEKCFEAGMDDFISKPTALDRLRSVLSQWLPGQESTGVPDLPDGSKSDKAQVIDLELLAEMMGSGETKIHNEILALFLPAAKASLAEIEEALLSGQADMIAAAAHGAKGEALGAAAVALGKMYEELEHKAKNGDMAGMPELGARAAAEVGRVESFIRQMV